MSETAGALRVIEYNARLYRRTWRGGLVGTFLAPILFLTSMGFGLGRFVDTNGATSGPLAGVTYAAFLAPGLLAAQAMQTAGFGSTYPIMGRLVWDRIYHGMLATPLSVAGIVAGELAWLAVRLTLVGIPFLIVMGAFGLVRSPLAVLAAPAAVLTGMAFAAPIVAFAGSQKDEQSFNAIFRFGITPLFLFSGTFFPIEQLPAVIRPIAWVTPLWHGVELIRGLTLGRLDPFGAVVHVGVLVAFVIAGSLVAVVTFRRALVR
jgi:lipooligosaccharide transport system permease protein